MSKRVGKDGVFLGLAGLILRISLGKSLEISVNMNLVVDQSLHRKDSRIYTYTLYTYIFIYEKKYVNSVISAWAI